MKHAPADVAAVPLAVARWPGRVADYFALAKPRLNFLVVASSAAGYYLGAPRTPDPMAMAQAVVGTALVAGGSAALNQLYERDTDALMRRTRLRPLPDGRIAPADALLYGSVLAAAGLLVLATFANRLSAAVALATIAVYLGLYTPMKRRSPSSTLVGAVAGALPPLIGWTASHGSVSVGGWSLFAIVFLWQVPHFMSIAWMYRDDYGKAGFPMLPVVEPDGRRTGRQALTYAAALVPVSLAPMLIGVAGEVYFALALVLGAALVWLAARFAVQRSDAAARALFFATIVYLPLVWIAMVADRI